VNTIDGLQNAPRQDVDVTMISGLKYVANFTRRISKEPEKDRSRFLKVSTTSLPLLGYADRTWSPRGTRTTTYSCNPHKTTTISI